MLHPQCTDHPLASLPQHVVGGKMPAGSRNRWDIYIDIKMCWVEEASTKNESIRRNVNPHSSLLNSVSPNVGASMQILEKACSKNWEVQRTREIIDTKNRVFQFIKYFCSWISCGSQINGTKSPLEENIMAVTCCWPQNEKFSYCTSG